MALPTPPDSSPYGPYLRIGRAGAGNFTWQSEQPQWENSDLEAQTTSNLSERRRAAAKVEHLDTDAAVRAKAKALQKSASQYVRVGRGYVHVSELDPSPRTAGLLSAHTSPTNTRPVMHPGRGGAGNLAVAQEANDKATERREQKEREKAHAVREEIATKVEHELPVPPDAWLGGRRRSEVAPHPE